MFSVDRDIKKGLFTLISVECNIVSIVNIMKISRFIAESVRSRVKSIRNTVESIDKIMKKAGNLGLPAIRGGFPGVESGN